MLNTAPIINIYITKNFNFLSVLKPELSTHENNLKFGSDVHNFFMKCMKCLPKITCVNEANDHISKNRKSTFPNFFIAKIES